MSSKVEVVLVVGATGSVGKFVVAEALRRGHQVRALARDLRKSSGLPPEVEVIIGDVTRPVTLEAAVNGIDAVVLTLGSDGAGGGGAETVDYGGVRNVLIALGSRPARVVLMSAIGVTDRAGDYNLRTQAHDWKRRAERLVRASGRPYTIVRPGWFDYSRADERQLVFLQGDTRRNGDPRDGAIARSQIATVLIGSLSCEEAEGKTFELLAERGEQQDDLCHLFGSLASDERGLVDGVLDEDNQPLAAEPTRVRRELEAMTSGRTGGTGARQRTQPGEALW